MSNIEESLNKIFQDNRIVFWFDQDGKMKEEYAMVMPKDVEKIEIHRNEFATKLRVLKKEPQQKFLLYFSSGQPTYEDNWLLDLQLANYVFHTDQEALFLQDIGLPYHFKALVEEHIEFFQNKERRLKLKELLSDDDAHKSIRYKMLAVLFNTDYPNLEAFLQSYALAFNDSNDRIERDLVRFNLMEYLWQEVFRKYKYQSESPSIYEFLLEIFGRNFILTRKGGSESHLFISLWKDSIMFQDAYQSLSKRVAIDMDVENLLNEAKLEEIIDDDIFDLTDLKVIYELSAQVENETILPDQLNKMIKKRENKYWYPRHKQFYYCLEHAGAMIDLVRKIKSFSFPSIESGVADYKDQFFLIDYHYRKFIHAYRKISQNRIISKLSDKVEKVYSNDWLLSLNDSWQQTISEANGWPVESIHFQQRFFKQYVAPFSEKENRLFVVISDAFRFEAGWELAKEIQSEKRYEAELDFMFTGLPSYTQLGMAAMLPCEQLSVSANSDMILVDGITSQGTPARTRILQEKSGTTAVAIPAEEFMRMNAGTEGREFVKQYNLIYIYHNRIDKAGDDKTTEDKVFEAVEEEIVFLQEVLKKIANMNGTNIIITSDHGFIYQSATLDESDFASSEIQGEIWKESRRFVIGKDLNGNNSLNKFNGSQVGLTSDVDILIPKGINRLRIKGAGSRFVHGGASLQEIVVPVIKVVKKRKDTTKMVDVDIIKSTDKITTNILPVSFLQKDLITDKILPRQIRAFIQTIEDGVQLSDIFKYTFDVEEGSERRREVKHSFQLSSIASGKYRNQRVRLLLEEPVPGTTRWKMYEEHFYTLNISFTNDFDDF
ncbi:MAG TPA: BREX-1 system phosphatase PglZ type A [Bacteroidales bacterium]|nr:BREX-1 system phosphatase PglZ type A [Bacteroidales bacterium]